MVSLRTRIGITVRALAAIFGGYAVAAESSVVIALWSPARPDDAAISGMLASFLIYAVAIMGTFAARSAGRACFGLALTWLIFSGAAWLSHAGG